jgi:thymidylate synthase
MMKNPEEQQYLNLNRDILERGTTECGRNGNTLSLFGASMRFSLKDGKMPILTTKKIAWKTCLKELLWFVRGQTDNSLLQKEGVHIWDANCTREFLDSRGLVERKVNDLGPIYGFQWRHYQAKYTDCGADYDGQGVDQLQSIIDQLKNPATRNSRRLIMTAWNPCAIDDMALPPCHMMCQFNVHDGNKLSCSMYQRSSDEFLGSPFNIASYSFLTHLLAKHCGLEACEFVYFIGNAHIYEDHIDAVKEQIEREPYEFPTVEIINLRENISDYQVADFVVSNYKSHEAIKRGMIA